MAFLKQINYWFTYYLYNAVCNFNFSMEKTELKEWKKKLIKKIIEKREAR